MTEREGPVEHWVQTKASSAAQAAAAAEASSPLPPALAEGIPKVGDVILGGKYEIERIIGVGGMGVVIGAIHKRLGGRVAFKFLLPTVQTDEFIDRFLREGQAAQKVQSEHIARVLDAGTLDNGTPYLMMEHLVGADLAEYLAEQGALPVSDAVDFIIQACDALASAHAAGIVHRDLKPSNLFITTRSDGSPLVKVLDFGISKLAHTDVAAINPKTNLTRPGTLLGSPMYMSPEQLENAQGVDHRADIWAIGTVLHQLVVGAPMFDAETFLRLCSTIMNDPPPPLLDLKPDAPAELEPIIFRCVEKDPGDRYQSIAELALDLAPLAPPDARVLAGRIAKMARPPVSSTPKLSAMSAKLDVTKPSTPAGRRTPARDSARVLVKDPTTNPDTSPLARTESTPSSPSPSSPPPPPPPMASQSSPLAANLAISTHRDPPATDRRRVIAIAVGAVAGLAIALFVVILSRANAQHTNAARSISPTTSALASTEARVEPLPPTTPSATATQASPDVTPPDPGAPPPASASASLAGGAPRKPGSAPRARPSTAPATSPASKPTSEGELLLDRH